tara:strand:+ start:1148 stop:1447 length:300 start_codon:yes stop_codon:yes gene_type:complete
MNHLYIIQSSNNGNFKIGRSKHPAKRLGQLQTGSPYELKLVLVMTDCGHKEKHLHERFPEKGRECKGEWFDFSLMGYLPDEVTELLDLDLINTWWSSDV